MTLNKVFAGTQIKRLRERLELTQASLAGTLGLSPSYLNQIERNQRPLPQLIMHALSHRFGVTLDYFGDAHGLRQAQALREAMADPMFGNESFDPAEARRVADAAEETTRRLLILYRAYRNQAEQLRALQGRAEVPDVTGIYEEVRDWVQTHDNHFDALDRAAEALAEMIRPTGLPAWDALVGRLRDRHGLHVESAPELIHEGTFWKLQRRRGRLLLAEAGLESRLFWMAHILATLEQRPAMDRELRAAQLTSDSARALAGVALANYFAGALLMPYTSFLEAAQSMRYDIERLQTRFGTSFEQVCHRLSTLQRTECPGIPFFFLKTDVAGNVMKRSSANRFHFAQIGAPCPLWSVYRAFSAPGQLQVQLAETPDRATYLTVARTVGRGGGAYLSRPRAVAVVLGCDAARAAQTVYATGLDLHDSRSAVPVGPGCRVCSREDCRHRAVPPIGHALDVGSRERGLVPYRIRGSGPTAEKACNRDITAASLPYGAGASKDASLDTSEMAAGRKIR